MKKIKDINQSLSNMPIESYLNRLVRVVNSISIDIPLRPLMVLCDEDKRIVFVKWDDESTTIVRCNEKDKYSRVFGYLIAFYQKSEGISKKEYSNRFIAYGINNSFMAFLHTYWMIMNNVYSIKESNYILESILLDRINND